MSSEKTEDHIGTISLALETGFSHFDEGDPVSVQQMIGDLSRSVYRVAESITPNVAGNRDKTDNYVSSLTEAIIGMTAGLCKIADSINNLADVVADLKMQ